jgi:hypothetical protein
MTATTRNWSDMGLRWESETVRKQYGPNKSDIRTVRTDAQIPVIFDLDAFRLHFGDEPLLDMADGTSLRVKAQGINRAEACLKMDADELRETIYNAIRGMRRSGSRTTTVVKYPLPDGTFYTGTDLVEYQSAYTAALVDAGVAADVARSIALSLKF